jgi:hypothetical protein
MKIIEVTEAFNMGNFARGVGRDLMSMWTGVDKPGGKDWFAQPEPPPKTTVERITDEIVKKWPSTVIQVMSKTRDPDRDATGVNDFTKIDRRQLAMEASLLTSQLLKQLTNNVVPNISAIPTLKTKDAVKKSIDPAKSAADVDRVNAEIRTSLNALMTADPSTDAGKHQMMLSWQKIVNAAYLINSIMATPDKAQYGLAGKKIARDARGNITLDGRPLNISNAADAQILHDIMTQGLNPP